MSKAASIVMFSFMDLFTDWMGDHAVQRLGDTRLLASRRPLPRLGSYNLLGSFEFLSQRFIGNILHADVFIDRHASRDGRALAQRHEDWLHTDRTVRDVRQVGGFLRAPMSRAEKQSTSRPGPVAW